jgi:signal transduction histidine kinase/CheY-like chemotaxis protein
MHLIKGKSIEQKLGLLFSFATIFAFGISVIGFSVILIFYSYRDFTRELSSVANVIGASSRTALIFRDSVAGDRILSGLTAKKNVKYSSLTDLEGDVVAEFGTVPENFQRVTVKHETVFWTTGEVSLNLPIFLEEELIGQLTVISGLETFYEQLTVVLWITIFIACLIAVGVIFFRKALRSWVVEPIASLMKSTQSLSETKDFSFRLSVPTQQKDEISELIQSFNHMMSQIEERDNALIAAKNKAEESDKLKTIFLATVSHELRTPLHAILGMTDEVLESEVNNDQKTLLEIIKSSGSLLISVINDILDFSKIEAGKLVLIATPLNIRDVIGRVLNLFELSASNKSVKLNVAIADDVPASILADGSRLTQILVNLVGNALKFTNTGHLEVAVRVREEVSTTKSIGLQFTVSDTGIGIPESELKTIFEAFSQLRSKTDNQDGTGLGLAISSRLVHLMGGWIWAESRIGEGSRFHFVIKTESVRAADFKPDISESEMSVPAPPPEIDEPKKNKNLVILAVDDNKVNQLLSERVLKREGYKVIVAWNGQEALDSFGMNKIDLVLMDLTMPVMDGLTAARAIRELETTVGRRPVPIIALTANALDEQRLECFAAGMDEYLTKPLERKKLLNCIEKLLEREF